MNLIRASVQGIVFLVESDTGRVFTYNPTRPMYVGDLEKIPEKDKNSISKTNGCLATARVRYRADIKEAMAIERTRSKNEATMTMATTVVTVTVATEPTTPISSP